MDTTSPLFLAALLANGPIKWTVHLFPIMGKIRKCKSKRGPRNPEQKGSDKRRIVPRKPVNVENLPPGNQGFTDMAS